VLCLILWHTDSLSLRDYDTHTNTKGDFGSSEEEFRDEEEEEERDKDGVSEEDILSQVGIFQMPQHHELIPLSILGCDQQNMEIILCDFEWDGYRLANVFADGWSTGSRKRKMTLWGRPQAHYFLITKTLSKRLSTRYCWRNIVC